MKKYILCYCLAVVCHLYGMDQNSNYAALNPSAPTYSMMDKLKEYPNLYTFVTKGTNLESRLGDCSNPETQMAILFGTLEEKIIKKNEKTPTVSIVQSSNGTQLKNRHFGGNVNLINSREATINNGSKIVTINSQTQKTYFSYAIPLGGLFCLGLLWYLK